MTRDLGPAGPQRRGWATTGQVSSCRSVVRSRRFGRSGAPGGVAFAVGLTVIPLAMSGNLVGLPAFGPQQSCSRAASQLAASKQATDSIPANYLADYQKVGAKSGIPWEVLAGIGEVESNHGRANLPGVRSGQNG